MTGQCAIRCSTIVAAVGFLAAVLSCPVIVTAERLSVDPAITKIKPMGGNHSQSALQVRKQVVLRPKQPTHQSGVFADEHLLIVRPSCPAPVQNLSFPIVPLFGEAAGDEDWVLLAGLRWEKDTGFGNKDSNRIQAVGGNGLTSWYYTVEMLFIPKGNWSIRASLAFDSSDVHDALVEPSQKLNPLQFGVAITFDYGDKRPMVFDLGYGRLPLEGKILSVRSRSEEAYQAKPDMDYSETNSVSACLNIQF